MTWSWSLTLPVQLDENEKARKFFRHESFPNTFKVKLGGHLNHSQKLGGHFWCALLITLMSTSFCSFSHYGEMLKMPVAHLMPCPQMTLLLRNAGCQFSGMFVTSIQRHWHGARIDKIVCVYKGIVDLWK